MSSQNVCEACVAQFPQCANLCHRCAEQLPTSIATCLACEAQAPAFVATYPAWQWGWPVSGLIKQFKFDGRVDLGKDLAAAFARRTADAGINDSIDALVPMPLHKTRLQERSFNQASVLAKALSQETNIPLMNAAIRNRHTQAQSGLNRQQRLKNLRGAFEIIETVSGLNVAIVDDVMTTGSSAQMLSQALLDAGASSVVVIVVCKVA